MGELFKYFFKGMRMINNSATDSSYYYYDDSEPLSEIRNCFDLFVLQTNGNLYVSDSFNARVLVWTLNATKGIIVAGGNSYGNRADQLNKPRGIFVDQNETVYVADYENHRIQQWKKNATRGITVAGLCNIAIQSIYSSRSYAEK